MKSLKFIPLAIAYTALSWLLVHLLAFFGIFVAMAYPIWWAIHPSSTICFSCRSKKNGKKCSLCKKTIDTQDGIYPHVSNIGSAIKNGLLIAAFSIISIGLIFVESKILQRMGIPHTPKTVSFVIPSKGQFKIGEMFSMKIEIVGIETPINAVQADIGFDPSILEVVDISTEESFASVFIQKEIENEAGYARLTGGLPNPGFFSDRGVFGTVMFRGKSPGVVEVEFLPTSVVLANDGRGTNVLKEFASVSYLVLPEVIDKDEENMQKELISMSGRVLGETENKTQIKFYGEESVLGTSAEIEDGKDYPESNEKVSFFSWIGGIVEKADSFIIKMWGKLFKIRFK